MKISDFRLLNRCFDFQVPHKAGSASHHMLVVHHKAPAPGSQHMGLKVREAQHGMSSGTCAGVVEKGPSTDLV